MAARIRGVHSSSRSRTHAPVNAIRSMYHFVTRGFSNHETVIRPDDGGGSLAARRRPIDRTPARMARDGYCPVFAVGSPKIPIFRPAAVTTKGLFWIGTKKWGDCR